MKRLRICSDGVIVNVNGLTMAQAVRVMKFKKLSIFLKKVKSPADCNQSEEQGPMHLVDNGAGLKARSVVGEQTTMFSSHFNGFGWNIIRSPSKFVT